MWESVLTSWDEITKTVHMAGEEVEELNLVQFRIKLLRKR